MSLYDDLGVSPGATPEQVRDAYRRAAKRHHPDRGGDPRQFAKVQRAALILRDPEKRERYDREGVIDDEPDREISEIARVIGVAFQQALGSAHDVRYVDLIKATKAQIRDAIGKIKVNRSQAREAVARISDAVERLTHQGERPDVVGNILKDHLRTAEQQVQDCDRAIRLHETAIEFADDYSWRADAAPEQSVMWIRLDSTSA